MEHQSVLHSGMRPLVLGWAVLSLAAHACWPAVAGAAERRFELRYAFTVQGVAAAARGVVAWVPIPPSLAFQQLAEPQVAGPFPHEVVTEVRHGNRFLRFAIPSGSLSKGSSPEIAITFRARRTPFSVLAQGQAEERVRDATAELFLGPDRLVPIDGRIAAEARRVTDGVSEPLARARRLYDHIFETLKYDKSGKGWGRGDALYACDVRAGNCTDFHSLFIAEARSLGIPARFILGLPLPEAVREGPIPSYHCWAEFYIHRLGWVPVDISEASKDHAKRALFFGGLDANRIQFTTGRDLKLPGASGPPLNLVLYPYVEVDGKPHAQVVTQFSFRDTD